MGTFDSENRNATASDTLTDGEQGKLLAALHVLRDGQHPQVKALHSKIDAIAHPHNPAEQRVLAKFNTEVTNVMKADSRLTRTAAMERVRQENRSLEREMSAALRGAA